MSEEQYLVNFITLSVPHYPAPMTPGYGPKILQPEMIVNAMNGLGGIFSLGGAKGLNGWNGVGYKIQDFGT